MILRANTIWLAVASLLIASAVAGAVDKKGTIAELKQRFAKSKGKDRVELGVVIAQRQMEAAEKAFDKGDLDTGQIAVADVAQYGADAAHVSSTKRERMKHTEIDLRKISERLDNLARSVDLDSRPPVQEALKKLEAARNNLLQSMFK